MPVRQSRTSVAVLLRQFNVASIGPLTTIFWSRHLHLLPGILQRRAHRYPPLTNSTATSLCEAGLRFAGLLHTPTLKRNVFVLPADFVKGKRARVRPTSRYDKPWDVEVGQLITSANRVLGCRAERIGGW